MLREALQSIKLKLAEKDQTNWKGQSILDNLIVKTRLGNIYISEINTEPLKLDQTYKNIFSSIIIGHNIQTTPKKVVKNNRNYFENPKLYIRHPCFVKLKQENLQVFLENISVLYNDFLLGENVIL